MNFRIDDVMMHLEPHVGFTETVSSGNTHNNICNKLNNISGKAKKSIRGQLNKQITYLKVKMAESCSTQVSATYSKVLIGCLDSLPN